MPPVSRYLRYTGWRPRSPPPGRASETLGKVLTGWTLSLVAGVSLSAILADVLQWRLVYAALALSACLVLVALLRSPLEGPARVVERSSPLTAWRIAGARPILFAVACYMVAFYGLYAYLGTHLTAQLGLSTTLAGLAALSYGVGFGVIAPLDRVIDTYGATRTAPFVFGALVGAYALLGLFAGSAVGLFALCFVWGAANHLGLNVLVGQLTALSASQRATLLGLYSAVTYLAMFLGTAAFKWVFEAAGFAVTAALAAVCIVPAMAGAIRRARV